MSKFDAVILAGAPAGSDFYPENGEISRAMVPIGNKTMLQWVIDALRGSDKIGKVIAIGNVDGNGLDLVLTPGESLVENIRKGVEALDTNEPVLIVSSDIPLITPEAIDDFLSRAERLNADLAYPVLPKTHCEKQYPQFKRTYVKMAEGTFTGGNIMLVRPDFLIKNWEIISNAYAARKQVFRLARIIGFGVLVRLIAAQIIPGVLKISMLERAVSKMLGAKVAAIVSAYPEIGEDIDKPSDLEAVRKILA